jgi:purine-binding chemotaxis protein CheW
MQSMEPAAPAAAGKAGGARGSEFLAFRLGAEEYGIEILKVQEIRGYEAVTAIANVPPFIKGVVNLRGVIVPIVDLRIRFNLERAEYDELTVVIILKLDDRVVGVVVDSVADVITIPADQVRPAPEFSSSLGVDHITGLGTMDDRMLILLDIEAFMSSEQMGLRRTTLDS